MWREGKYALKYEKICAEAYFIPRKQCGGEKSMPLKRKKHDMRHFLCCAKGTAQRNLCLITRKVVV